MSLIRSRNLDIHVAAAGIGVFFVKRYTVKGCFALDGQSAGDVDCRHRLVAFVIVTFVVNKARRIVDGCRDRPVSGRDIDVGGINSVRGLESSVKFAHIEL